MYNDPNIHIRIFCKRWSLILGWFFPVSILNHSQQTLFQRWYLVENENWGDVHLSTLFQRWQNNVETMLIGLRRFNVDEPTLFQCWNLVENGSWANACLPALFQRWQDIETTLIELRWFNVDDPMLFQRWY